jgi:hypothetical protein
VRDHLDEIPIEVILEQVGAGEKLARQEVPGIECECSVQFEQRTNWDKVG